MQHSEDARKLAESMVRVGTELGIEVKAQLTQMDHPIGEWLGNSHEIAESIACLKGMGPHDTMELVYAQANALGFDISESIENGSALQEFKSMLDVKGLNLLLLSNSLTTHGVYYHVRLNNTHFSQKNQDLWPILMHSPLVKCCVKQGLVVRSKVKTSTMA